jgi:acylphosphatase
MGKGLHCYVSGRVQGVCFRMSTQMQANSYGLTGWVRNLQNGQVEVMAFGEERQLKIFRQWLNSGPSMAQVIGVESESVEFQKFEVFSIR